MDQGLVQLPSVPEADTAADDQRPSRLLRVQSHQGLDQLSRGPAVVLRQVLDRWHLLLVLASGLRRRPVMNAGQMFHQVCNPPVTAPRDRCAGVYVADRGCELLLQLGQQLQLFDLVHGVVHNVILTPNHSLSAADSGTQIAIVLRNPHTWG